MRALLPRLLLALAFLTPVAAWASSARESCPMPGCTDCAHCPLCHHAVH